MNPLLMYKDADFDPAFSPSVHQQELMADLALDTLFQAMADDDSYCHAVVQKAVLSGAPDVETVIYRQDIVKDCLMNAQTVRDMYQVTLDCIEKKRERRLSFFSRYPSAVLSNAIDLLRLFLGQLRIIRRMADELSSRFQSEGFTAFFSMLRRELDDDYFRTVEKHLDTLKFPHGVLIGAALGKGNEGTGYMLCTPDEKEPTWLQRLFNQREKEFTFHIHPRDVSGAQALSELKSRGINEVANALAQAADHVDHFFSVLRAELAFYLGCVRLYEKMAHLGLHCVFPVPAPASGRAHAFDDLFDISLALTMQRPVVANSMNADGKDLVMITGANQGGKSTFLRSIGIAQMMMQCGMFVPARSFRSSFSAGLYTHYRRREDDTMTSGKLDEELSRMSRLADLVRPDDVILFNESFAATNEREGAEIARQIVRALIEKRVRVVYVTHNYELAHGFHDKHTGRALFLRAERDSTGGRPFKIVEGEPLSTSFGQDLYRTIFDDVTPADTTGSS